MMCKDCKDAGQLLSGGYTVAAKALHRLCTESAQRGTGIFDEKERLVISGDRIEDLPGPLEEFRFLFEGREADR